MACSIMIAMDDSQNAEKALNYVANNLNPNAKVTILTILPKVASACGMDSPSLTPLFSRNSQVFCNLENAKRERMKECVEAAKEHLTGAGFSSDRIETRVLMQESGIARDILKEVREGDYDTLVMGRHGLSGVKDFFSGSVTNKVVQRVSGITVIIVD